MTDFAYFVRSIRYGSPGLVGYEMDGKPVHDQHGGYVCCPRCTSPLSVGFSQLNHGPVNPHSIAHTSLRLDRLAAGERVRCGAHWVMGDPEEVMSHDVVPRALWDSLQGFRAGTAEVYRRPVGWHGDV